MKALVQRLSFCFEKPSKRTNSDQKPTTRSEEKQVLWVHIEPFVPSPKCFNCYRSAGGLNSKTPKDQTPPLPLELFTHILMQSDVLDLVRWRVVCSSWASQCFSSIRSVDNSVQQYITEEILTTFTNLTSLSLPLPLTDSTLLKLTNLRTLTIRQENFITNSGLAALSKLLSLNLGLSCFITNTGIAPLQSLTSLNLGLNSSISDATLRSLTNLKILQLGANKNITDNSISVLTNLQSLALGQNKSVSGAGIQGLTSLTSLHLGLACALRDEHIKNLLNLRELTVNPNCFVSNWGISHLANLKELNMNFEDQFFEHL